MATWTVTGLSLSPGTLAVRTTKHDSNSEPNAGSRVRVRLPVARGRGTVIVMTVTRTVTVYALRRRQTGPEPPLLPGPSLAGKSRLEFT